MPIPFRYAPILQSGGIPLPPEPYINLTGGGAVDNPTAHRIDLSLSGRDISVKDYPYLAKGDGVTDDTAAINAALAAAALTKNRTFAPAGTYIIDTASGVGNVAVVLQNGSYLYGEGRGSTIFKLKANAAGGSAGNTAYYLSRNAHPTGGDENIVIQDVCFDGNGNNQTNLMNGVSVWAARGCSFNRVLVKNCRGINATDQETFHMDSVWNTDTTFNDCMVGNFDGGQTASGFSGNGSTGNRWINCSAFGMNNSQGFTCNAITDSMYIGCRAYKNGGNGFNFEFSDGVVYLGCIAGGSVVEGSGFTYPYAPGTSLGNTGAGFVLNGTSSTTSTGTYELRGVHLVECISERNTGVGVVVAANTNTYFNGGSYIGNGGGIGIQFQGNSEQLARFESQPRCDLYQATSGLGSWNVPARLPLFPAVPSSGVNIHNPYPFPVDIYITGGTNVSIYLNGYSSPVGGSSSADRLVRIPSYIDGGQIGFLYAAAPTWQVWC